MRARALATSAAAPAPFALRYAPGSASLESWTGHAELRRWVAAQAALLKPSHVHLCDGSQTEARRITAELIGAGALLRLNPLLRPNSFLARSTPSDTARVESRTFICSARKEDAGVLNNWLDPSATRAALQTQLDGVMRGRTMFVVPFCMGPLKSDFSALGVQLTDSRYVVANMRIMTRMGAGALEELGAAKFFVRATHSVGVPLKPGEQDVPWPDAAVKTIAHFPDDKEIVSVGSGYGGNAILPKKSYALRIASVMARDQGWLAEHMTISKVTPPPELGLGGPRYVCASFPSACGKTNFAMMSVPEEYSRAGWRVELCGDDIAWLRIGADGRLWASNPENGIFGVAPGTSRATNPAAVAACSSDSLFTNVALDTDTNDVWWKGLGSPPPHLVSWLKRDWHEALAGSAEQPEDAAQANSRFTAPLTNCPNLAKEYDSPLGVPISAIIFGGRRAQTVPLVSQARSWRDGVLTGATLASEQTAAAEGKPGELRYDPMSMRPFIGYDAPSYFAHWLSMEGRTPSSKLPASCRGGPCTQAHASPIRA